MTQQKKFGPFILGRMIGRGGMGAVYQAAHETTGQVVAVKALLAPLEDERERFEAEISTLKLLRHENIVKLFGFGQEDGVLYYAMEFVDGPSLATLLRRGRRFSWEEVVFVGISVCKALKHAHDRGVVHRDIKPANILLQEDGCIKVSDYGIAQYFGNSRLTGANQIVGTIEYMAPEQAQAGPLTPRTDVYALGALLYALLTGAPPYVARSLPELLWQYRQGAPESIRVARPEAPKVLDDFLMNLLQILPEKRPGDARLIERRLQGILKTASIDPEGNPFLQRRVSNEGRTSTSESESNSRVDLENTNDDSWRNAAENEAELTIAVPDFPYRAIDEASNEREQFAVFEQTTEIARGSQKRSNDASDSDDKNSDFDLGDFELEGESNETRENAEKSSDSGDLETLVLDRSNENDRQTSTSERRLDEEVAVDKTSDADKRFRPTNGARVNEKLVSPGFSADLAAAPTLGVATSKPDELDDGFDFNDSAAASSDEIEPINAADRDATIVQNVSTSEKNASTVLAPAIAASCADETGDFDLRSVPGVDETIVLAADEVAPGFEASTIPLDRLRNPDNFGETTLANALNLDFKCEKEQEKTEICVNAPDDFEIDVPSDERSTADSGVDDESDEAVVATPLEKFKRSRFTPVDEKELGKLPTRSEEKSFYPIATILVGIVVLLAVGALFWRAFRTPSADELYERIERALKQSDEENLGAALRKSENDLTKFLNLYPNDSRAQEIRYYVSELELETMETRLERLVQRNWNDANATPVERAYLEASRIAKIDKEEGVVKLSAFVDLFDSAAVRETLATADEISDEAPATADEISDETPATADEISDETPATAEEKRAVVSLTDQLVIVARRRLERLKEETETLRNADLELLNNRLTVALELREINPEYAEKMRRALIELYGERVWASETLKSVREPFVVEPTAGESPNAEPTAGESPNAEPTAGESPNVEPAGDELSNVESGADDLPNIEPAGDELPNAEPGADELPNAEPGADELPNIEPAGDELPNAESVADELPNIEPAGDELPNAESGADDLPNIEAGANELPNAEPVADELSNVEPVAVERRQ